MLAQIADAATPTTIVGAFIFVCLALVALLGWVLKHLFATTIPGIMAEQKEQRECNEKNLTTIISAYQSETKAERDLCAEQFTLVRAGLATLTTACGQHNEIMARTINEHTTEQMAAYRHEMYDKINQAVLGKELYLAQKAADKRAAEGDK
jgi:hypothetical protein